MPSKPKRPVLWIGEWMATHETVVFDPALQQGATVVRLFRVATRQTMDILLNRMPGKVQQFPSIDGYEADLETYRQWQAEQVDRARLNPQRAGRKAVAALSRLREADEGDIRIRDDVFNADWAAFQEIFPGGFEDPGFLREEREPRVAAQARVARELEQEAFGTLKEEELVARLRRAFAATDNFLASVQHAAVDGALKAAGPHRQRLLDAYFELIWGEGLEEERFVAWSDAIEALPTSGKSSAFQWPVVTALPYLAQPERHCAMKPMSAKRAAARYGVNIGYVPQPNFTTYRRWLDLVEALEQRLGPLGARDRFDVQSFLWRVDGAQ